MEINNLELISAVEDIPLEELRINDFTKCLERYNVRAFNWSEGCYGRWDNLNLIPEVFASKCKKWALKHIIDKEIQSAGCIISSWSSPDSKGKARILVIDETFVGDTEAEAVMKATEWVRLYGEKL